MKRFGRPLAPLDYTKRLWMRCWMAAVIFFLYAPLVALVVFSFNDSKRNIVWRGFTFKYYEKLIGNASLMEALGNSLTIAFFCTIFSVILGALAAVMLWRFRFPFKAGVEGAMGLPIVVPEICFGVAMLVFFAGIGWPTDLPWPFSLSAITIAHITFCFPFVAMVVRSRLRRSTEKRRKPQKTWVQANGKPFAMSCCHICAPDSSLGPCCHSPYRLMIL